MCLKNIIIGTSDLQRKFRFYLKNTVKEYKSGDQSLSPADILYFLKLIYWKKDLDIFEFHIKNGIPIYLIENNFLSLFFIPKLKRQELKD